MILIVKSIINVRCDRRLWYGSATPYLRVRVKVRVRVRVRLIVRVRLDKEVMLDLGPERARCLICGENRLYNQQPQTKKNKITRPSPRMFAAPVFSLIWGCRLLHPGMTVILVRLNILKMTAFPG